MCVCVCVKNILAGYRKSSFWDWENLTIKFLNLTCNHARTVLCMTSWIVNRRPRTASCSSIISLVDFLIHSSKARARFPFKCWRSSNTISSLAWSNHFTLITCKLSYIMKGKFINHKQRFFYFYFYFLPYLHIRTSTRTSMLVES